MENKQLTPEQLIATRYKVIADYPGSPWKIGRILTEIRLNTYDCIEAPCSEGVRNPHKYPAVFKKLKWWEGRKAEEMPEYVKRGSGDIHKILSVQADSSGDLYYHFLGDDKGIGYYLHGCEISTETEYLNSLTQNNSNGE